MSVLDTAATDAVAAFFNEKGRAIQASANEPLPLIDPRAVWLVRKGHLDVFAVTIVHERGAADVQRTPLMRIEQGELLFGFKAPGSGQNVLLLGFGSVDAEVIRLPVSTLAEHAMNDPDTIGGRLIPLIDRWIDRICDLCAQDQMPSGAVNLRPAVECVLEEGQSAQPQSGVLWLMFIEGAASFMGHAQQVNKSSSQQVDNAEANEPIAGVALLTCQSVDSSCAFPISKHAWVTSAEGGCCFRACRASEIVCTAEYWEGLNAFHDTVEKVIDLQRTRDRERDRRRLEAKSEHNRAVVRHAFGSLQAVLGRPRSAALALGDGFAPHAALLACCRLVGERLGVAVTGSGQRVSGHDQAELGTQRELDAIARTSRFALRQVQLRAGWHREDGGPLLGFLKSSPSLRGGNDEEWMSDSEGRTLTPIALLPAAPGRYELHNPGEGTVRRVTRHIAAEVSPTAFSFYRTLPDRPLKAMDLLRFCLHGLRRDLVRTGLLGAGGALLTLATPMAVGHIFDTVVPGAERAQLLQVTIGLIIAALAVGAFQITRNIALIRVQHRAVPSLQAAVWERTINLPARFFSKYSAGDLAVRAMGVDNINDAVSTAAITTLITSAFSIVSLGLLFWYSPTLALLAMGMVVIVLAVVVGSGLLQLRYQRAVEEIQGKIAGTMFQFMTGVSKLRVAAAEERAFAQWAKRFAEQMRLVLRTRIISNNLAVFYALVPVATFMVIFWVMGRGLGRGLGALSPVGGAASEAMSTGAFLAFISAFTILLFGMMQAGSVVVSMLNAAPIYGRLKPILEATPEVDAAKHDPGSLRGRIEVSNVTFHYERDGPAILQDVSIHADPGEFVTIVGPSGSGKSTLLRILLGFEQPESGSVAYDGFDCSTLDPRALRRQIGCVLQTSALLPGDVFTNIVGSAVDLTVNDAWEAARLAGIEDDIREMPMGMHTVIAEGAGTLSGGQRQRIMIARALVNKPRIVFFDEATSALDNPTQAIVTESLDRMRATRIVIAHRLSTIVNADRIYVLERGRIVQHGTYEELMTQPGLFYDLAKRQIA